MISEKIRFVKNQLPEHYLVSEESGHIRCVSSIGIKDSSYWDRFVKITKEELGSRFLTISHRNVLLNKNFIIFLKPEL
jgi:hypothetical protein